MKVCRISKAYLWKWRQGGLREKHCSIITTGKGVFLELIPLLSHVSLFYVQCDSWAFLSLSFSLKLAYMASGSLVDNWEKCDCLDTVGNAEPLADSLLCSSEQQAVPINVWRFFGICSSTVKRKWEWGQPSMKDVCWEHGNSSLGKKMADCTATSGLISHNQTFTFTNFTIALVCCLIFDCEGLLTHSI